MRITFSIKRARLIHPTAYLSLTSARDPLLIRRAGKRSNEAISRGVRIVPITKPFDFTRVKYSRLMITKSLFIFH